MVNNLLDPQRDLSLWVRERLKLYSIRLKKRLSQVILLNTKTLERMARMLKDLSTIHRFSSVIEIGSGPGTLTLYLAKECNHLYIIAIEIDERFSAILREIQEYFWNVDIIIGDAIQLINVLRSNVAIGNLPYHITSDILIEIAKRIDIALITVQKDVSMKIISKPGSKSYGKISILLQLLFDIKYIGSIPSRFFRPRPKVDSAILLLIRKRIYDETIERIEKLTKCLFSYRRKRIYKALRKCIDIEYIDKMLSYMEQNLWGKRVFQLSPRDIEKLVHIYVELKNGEKK